MPAKESAFDRFWRRERLTHKFKGAEKDAYVLRRGRIRPDKSVHWLAVAEERLNRRIAERLKEPAARMRKALLAKEMARLKINLLAPSPAITHLEVFLNFIRAEKLALAANIAQANYLGAVWREMKKGNMATRQLVKTRIDELLKSRAAIVDNIESLRLSFKQAETRFRKQFFEVSKMIQKDPGYRRHYNEAVHLREKLRLFGQGMLGRAIIDLVMLELKIKKPSEAKEREMLDTVQIAQLRVNSANAEIRAIDKYIGFLSLEKFENEFSALEKAARRFRARKESELRIYEKQLAEYNKWWYGKSTEQK